MRSPQPFLLPFVALPGKQSQHPPGLPSSYSCPPLQAGPGCTWPSMRTPWRATCGCSRRTWACCISTMSSECPHGLSHVAPELALSLIPKTRVTRRQHRVPHQRPGPALHTEDVSVMVKGPLGPCLLSSLVLCLCLILYPGLRSR